MIRLLPTLPTTRHPTQMPEDSPPLRVTMLGTGTSTGVPVLGCSCSVCTSSDPRDKRLRCACYIEAGPLGILVDAGPDFRQQAQRAGIRRIDAVCFTHHHFDHTAGIDDLRPFFYQNRRLMPCFANSNTVQKLKKRYSYIFGDTPYPGAARVQLKAVDEAFTVQSRYDDGSSLHIQPVPLWHGDTPTMGIRIGAFAYLTDASAIPESSFDLLDGVEVLVLDALRPDPHPTHFSFDEGVRVANRIGAQDTYFIHMTHAVRHAEQTAALPDHVHLAYDGLELKVPAPSESCTG